MYGNLIIKPSFPIKIDDYEFGISAVNEIVPYLWEGQLAERFGKQVIVFTCQKSGIYTWFVRRKSDNLIISNERIGVHLKQNETYHFSETRLEDGYDDTYFFDTINKKIILYAVHPLFNEEYSISLCSLNGFIVRAIKTGTLNLDCYAEVKIFENCIDLNLMQINATNILAITVNY